MTTFVLHGGKTSVDSPGTDNFFAQFTQLIPKNQIKVLMCYWARPINQWTNLLNRDLPKIIKPAKHQINAEVIKSPEELYVKLPNADGLYVAGGDAEPLEQYYPELNGLGKFLKGKVYLGSSMGAFMASSAYVLSMDSQEDKSVHNGLGLLPIKVLCHWNVESKKERKIDLLSEYLPSQPIVTLNEGEFVTLYQ